VDDHLSLLLVAQNYGDDKQAISAGVAYLDEDGDDDDDGDNDVTVDNSIEITNIVRNVVKNVNKNITIIGNGTGGNGNIVIPPPVGGNTTDSGTGGNTTDPGTGGNTTDTVTPPTGNTTAPATTSSAQQGQKQRSDRNESTKNSCPHSQPDNR
jgi:hypothetical protein